MADFTKVLHHKPYAAIDPTQPALSQAGRTILITGGGTGIGLAISRAFIAAGVSRLVLVARRRAVLDEGREALLKETKGKAPDILVEQCDIASGSDVARLWDNLRSQGVDIDRLCLNAASTGNLDSTWEEDDAVWNMFEINVHGNLRMVKAFLKQGPAKGKVIINVSTLGVHLSPTIPRHAAYSSTKMAFTATIQWIADELDPNEARVVSFHPGAIYTPAAEAAGYGPDALAWDDENLPANFTVWLSSPDAHFLHSRFVWAHWDIQELKAMKSQIENHPGWLRMGLQGPNPVNGKGFITKVTNPVSHQ